jgi:hypothetical protein
MTRSDRPAPNAITSPARQIGTADRSAYARDGQGWGDSAANPVISACSESSASGVPTAERPSTG